MRLLLLLIISLGMAVSLGSCKKEKCHDPSNPDCDNYDPCYGQVPVETEIELSQRVALTGIYEDLYLEADNIFPQTRIKFHCPLNGAKYTWTLGAETITTQTFERTFFTAPFGDYTVMLVVEKQPNKQCYPNDDGVDTIIKKFKIVQYCELESMGVFKGKWDKLSTDSGIVTIRAFRDGSYSDSCSINGIIRFTNLQNKQDTLEGDCFVSDTQLVHYGYPSLGFRKFSSQVDPLTKSVVIEFYISEEKHTFKGRKIAD